MYRPDRHRGSAERVARRPARHHPPFDPTAGGIMPVTQIDGTSIADGKVGPITSRLMHFIGKSMIARRGRAR